ncbi:MAG: PA14 domain-containing protein, partial [Opitutales bacterium]|nr:PA14 domain-containing protein [Opitutales bacterium]
MKHIPLYLFAFPLFISYAMALDENGNGLSDVWEQRFNASDLVLEDDDDGDRFTNLEECIAGTDPNDSTDHPQLFPTVINETGVEMQLHFDTLRGKSYTVSHSSDLTNFYDVPPSWSGDNATRSLSIQNDGVAETLSSIRIDFWSDLPGDTISDLHDLSTYPSAPDGTAYNALPKAPDFLATGYGARLSCWIEAPQTGAYTFFLTAGGPAELYLDLTPDEKSTLKIAEVLPTQTGLAPSEWDTYATQRSDAVDLIAGNRYHIELHYVSTIPRQHAQIAWSLPGTAEIELLERDDLAKVFFHTKTVSGNTLLEHDYDSIGQTGTLWPNNTSIEAGPTGTSGDVERVSGNVGTGSEERLTLGSGSSDHFYATWLFN